MNYAWMILVRRHHQSRISTGRRTIPQWEEVVAPIEIKKIIPPLTHAQEQPVCPPPQVCLDATLTGKDSRHESLNQIKINTSKGNSINQEFSSIRESFLNREIIIPLKFKKKKNIPPPFSPLGAFLDADDDEDTNKCSSRWMIKTARNKPDGYEKQNLKQSSSFKRRSGLSRASICGGIAGPFPFFCRSNSDVYVPNVKGIPLSSKRFS
ncbi:hypothetical protein POTOM_055268 [Populus tomentosa]|uniref:Uncharacterized protein n=1 Tax=Populus tomentosa TaxID=118781 RepID=A0A8X7Y080_POPTO|nr:hypothetical protein POTOM_055268 [Populus tomentosa]